MRIAWGLVVITFLAGTVGAQTTPSAIVRAEFIATQPPTPSAHASTIVERASGLVAAWFGGTREGAPDVGIWLSRVVKGEWTKPIEVANGIQSDGSRFPCYNPVLFTSADDVLHLFYKVGPQPARWWGMHMESRDDGKTWSTPRRLPDGILGPVKNQPILLRDGTIVAGTSTESMDATPEWRVFFEISHDNARTWTRVAPAGPPIEAIQPAMLGYPGNVLQAVGRTRSGRIFETWSRDGGASWSALSLLSLPNPNAGIDALTLRDGRRIIVYNASTTERTPLSIAISRDSAGKVWTPVLVLEDGPGEFSYPAVTQSRDGLIHVTYTWKRQRIKHVVLDPSRL